ncbi:MAG: methyltransferase domain-containing protein [Rhizobiaceae bacterium]|nr:methyltransferase domain-containing protein [Rhizobiaceae bacterium]
MSERRFTFNDVATLYGEIRPTYPDEVFDDIIAAAELAADGRILEIGCGTGQATLGFAARGLAVVALDPGAELIRLARDNLAGFPAVRFVETTFEGWDAGPARFTLVVAAQSLHWVQPEIRLAKAADVLAPEGFLAVFANVPMPIPSPLGKNIAEIYARYAPSLSGPSAEAWYLPDGPFAAELYRSERFEQPWQRRYAWSRTHSAKSYTDLLRTLSGHRLLAPEQLETLLGAIADAIDAHGGQFELQYETHLYMARRVGG